jgi:hypothetical protein
MAVAGRIKDSAEPPIFLTTIGLRVEGSLQYAAVLRRTWPEAIMAASHNPTRSGSGTAQIDRRR